MSTIREAAVKRGDVVEVSSRRLGEPPRLGEIVEVLGRRDQEHYRVRWDDGHESVLYPGGATSVTPRRGRFGPKLDLAAATHDLIERLREESVEFELIPHRRTTTATGEARALGLLPQEVAKTVIARTPEGVHVRAVVPASRRVDVAKLAAAVSAPNVAVLSEADLVSAYPQFELGAVPPFGGPAGDVVVVDRALAAADHVVFEAGVHDTAVRISGETLVAVAGATTAGIAA